MPLKELVIMMSQQKKKRTPRVEHPYLPPCSHAHFTVCCARDLISFRLETQTDKRNLWYGNGTKSQKKNRLNKSYREREVESKNVGFLCKIYMIYPKKLEMPVCLGNSQLQKAKSPIENLVPLTNCLLL